MTDPPITKEELYQLHQIRVGKEKSRAQRCEKYRNPAISGIKFESEETKECNRIGPLFRLFYVAYSLPMS